MIMSFKKYTKRFRLNCSHLQDFFAAKKIKIILNVIMLLMGKRKMGCACTFFKDKLIRCNEQGLYNLALSPLPCSCYSTHVKEYSGNQFRCLAGSDILFLSWCSPIRTLKFLVMFLQFNCLRRIKLSFVKTTWDL